MLKKICSICYIQIYGIQFSAYKGRCFVQKLFTNAVVKTFVKKNFNWINMQFESINRGSWLINLISLIPQGDNVGYILRMTYQVMIDDVKMAVLTNQIP